MKNVLDLIKLQPHDHQALLEGIRIVKKRAKLIDVVTLYIESPFGSHQSSFFIKHESEEDDLLECRHAFTKIMGDHLDSIAKQTISTVIGES